MTLALLAFIGGVLTILSPCILPVIPLVFSRAERGFRQDNLPMLSGMALAFTAAASIATTTARWLLTVNELGRWLSLVVLAAVGLALVSERVAMALTSPLARLGGRLAARTSPVGPRPGRAGTLTNVLVGFAIGLLWAPCAGPILALLIAASASQPGRAPFLFLTFAIGAVMSLAAVLALGSSALKRLASTGRAHRAIRRTLGVATILTVAAIVLGWDRAFFAKGGIVQTAGAEEILVSRLAPGARIARTDATSLDEFAARERAAREAISLTAMDGVMPPLAGGTEWINSPELTPESLRGKVVLVDFWTFACYNCLNALPHVKALYEKYRDRGFVVVGVHTPELAHERLPANVRREVKSLGINYPVVIDNDNRIWNAWHNEYWPAAYYVDATGKLRFFHFGEGRYEDQDKVVAKLLAERDAAAAAR